MGTQNADGTFTGTGVWSNAYTYYGAITQASCSMVDGKLHVMFQWWFHDTVHHAIGEAKVECLYKVWTDTSPPTYESRFAFRDTRLYSETDLSGGTMPGQCPE